MGKSENKYQSELKERLYSIFPGCLIFKLDSSQDQGVPDLLILHRTKWAVLEVKKSANATHRPNQDDWVEELNKLSFSRFIFPENEKEVINELRLYFA